jgi:putative tricarboxylic transport membrane protein
MKGLADRITSAGFFLLALLVMGESLSLSMGDIHNPGPGFVPFFLGLSMAILSSLTFWAPESRMNEEAVRDRWRQGKNILFIFAGLVVYLLLFNLLGFLLNTFLLVIYLTKLAGAEGFRRSILVSFLAMGIVYLLFYRLLIIPFPRGILGI